MYGLINSVGQEWNGGEMDQSENREMGAGAEAGAGVSNPSTYPSLCVLWFL